LRSTILWGFLFFLLLCALEVLAILHTNDGSFFYSLDDPYIHLALAEEIFNGNYGVNPHEVCAPSSSILWPFLLVPFAPFSFFVFVPLVYNILSALGSILLLHNLVERSLRRCPLWLLCSLIVGLNLVGLAFTGMEHSLHVMLSLLTLLGVLELHQSGRVSASLWVGCIVGVCVRYEHLALVVASVLLLLFQRKKVALGLLLASFVTPVSFGLWLLSKNLSFLPTSVLTKSRTTNGGIVGLLETLFNNLNTTRGLLLLLGLGLVAAFFRRQDNKDRMLSGWVSLVVVLHLLVGRMGWFYRYEGYVFAVLGMTLLFFVGKNKGLLHWLAPWAVFVAWSPMLVLFHTPRATNDVYTQQHQLYRFSTEFYQAPIAVNDIGQVSFRNDQYILDLWGLASLEAARLIKTDPRWAETLVRKNKVQVIAMYAELLKEPPIDWVEIGSFEIDREKVTAAGPKVTIYATRDADITAIRALTKRFFETLPEGTKSTLIEQ
jgi:hypothetical protein